ncbi:uncharacterized protein AMSG_00725 [Thecamonas trahens ATCC 50062]|uniref:Rad50/SbcC-type AAA domain-containing protein n=1 Tax=Thecamonas trahens ATCC 50062 TaxID=461836 RepID=A0A0L0DE56_THETB|nr:hypothetical protein AMSG_00725 [Thecamonas trahens ATCC 50062]KNC50564.1 hypothetical protein AMSG_00725 [Thecamonas trahens ATCC 50062]|eukprot:XP_013762454.1 hypothetical protein AMSG_00725 [Thecamonas trahens ATCC 50062]
MSSIEKLLIRGIRSYATDNESCINFDKPLTIIVGKNGAGKTAIIESLRYATTGQLPPGCKLPSFISDPKMSRVPEIKAQIKLKFRNAAEQACVVSRGLVARQTRKSVTSKTIDVSMKLPGKDGQVTSITGKCSQVNVLIPKLLGVTAAVLNRVIFCQQNEEWILGSDSELKKVLDEIFDATAYREAIKTMKREIADNRQRIALFRRDLQNEETIRRHAKSNKDQLALVCEEMSQLESQAAEIEATIAPITDELAQLSKVAAKLDELERRAGELHVTIEVCERNCAAIKTSIQGFEFEESDDDLLRQQNEYLDTVQAAQTKLDTIEPLLKAEQAAAAPLANRYRAALTAHAELNSAALALNSFIAKRDARLTAANAELGLGLSASASPDDVRAALVKRVSSTSRELTAAEDAAAASQAASRAKIQELKVRQATLCAEREAAARAAAEARASISALAAASPVSAPGALAGIRAQLESATAARDAAEAVLASSARSGTGAKLKAELGALRGAREQLDAQLAAVDAELSRRTRFAGLQAALDSKTEAAEAKAAELAQLRADAAPLIEKVAGVDPATIRSADVAALEAQVNIALAKLAQDRDTASAAAREAQAQASVVAAQLGDATAELVEMEAKIKAHAKKIKKNTAKSKLEDVITKTQAHKDKLKSKLQAKKLTASSVVGQFKAFIAAAEDSHACPLCSRGFDSSSALAAFVSELASKLDEASSNVSTVKLQADLDECDVILARLDTLRPIAVELERLSTQAKPALEAKIAELKASAESTSAAAAAAEAGLEAAKSAADAGDELKSMIDELLRVEREASMAAAAVASATAELDAAKGAVGSGGDAALGAETTPQLHARVVSLKADLAAKRARSRELETEIEAAASALAAAERAASEAKAKVLELQNKEARAESALAKSEALTAALAEAEAKIKHADNSLAPLRAQLADAEAAALASATGADAKVRAARLRASAARDAADSLARMSTELAELERKGSPAALAKAKAALDQLESDMDASAQKRTELETAQSQLQAALADSKETKRLIDANIDYRKASRELDSLRELLAQANAKAAKLRGSTSSGLSLSELQVQHSKLSSKAAELQGLIKGKKAHADVLRAGLNEPQFQQGEANYEAKLIQIKTTEMASADLDRYQHALDSALQRYHTLKMAEVNKTIKMLWEKVYQNSDIDNIMIACTESDSARSAFKYELVAIRDGVETPMRARCSAGQARIASLIVRIALAESFCLHSGLIALDEPSAQLDKANARSMARALASIVNERSRQSNFQLILITHNQEFCHALNSKLERPPTKFWQVEKDSHGFSTITAREFGA